MKDIEKNRDVFVSHSSKDKTVADAICATLESHKIRCWIAPRDIVPGANWAEAIIQGIESSRLMIVVVSSNANKSTNVKKEVERAVNKGLIVIPFRTENIALSKGLEYFLSDCHWLDALSPPLEEGINALRESVDLLLNGKPNSADNIPLVSEPSADSIVDAEIVKSGPKVESTFKDELGGKATSGDGEAAETIAQLDVILTGFGDKKLEVVKVVKTIMGVTLLEAKKMVEGCPLTLRNAVSKEDCVKIKADVETAGGSVELKVTEFLLSDGKGASAEARQLSGELHTETNADSKTEEKFVETSGPAGNSRLKKSEPAISTALPVIVIVFAVPFLLLLVLTVTSFSALLGAYVSVELIGWEDWSTPGGAIGGSIGFVIALLCLAKICEFFDVP